MTALFMIGKWMLMMILIAAVILAAYVIFHPVFGGTPDPSGLQRISASKQFNGKVFENEEQTRMSTTDDYSLIFDWFRSAFNPPPGKVPSEPLPSEEFKGNPLENGEFIWLGHSTVLFQIAGQTVLTDPVFFRASPLPIAGKPFATAHPVDVTALPEIDAVLISHDHYDHLDYKTVRKIEKRVAHFFVPLGVKAHLQRWGIADDAITELDWHEQAVLEGITLTLTPARHFSGRNLHTGNATLWGSWVIASSECAVFFSGDSSYGRHFAEIGAQYGPFDIAFIENGAYNEKWADVHMMPEQSVQAVIDLRAKKAFPVHWAKFDLAFHPWKEPVERFLRAAKEKDVQTVTPQINQVFSLNALLQTNWWEKAR